MVPHDSLHILYVSSIAMGVVIVRNWAVNEIIITTTNATNYHPAREFFFTIVPVQDVPNPNPNPDPKS